MDWEVWLLDSHLYEYFLIVSRYFGEVSRTRINQKMLRVCLDRIYFAEIENLLLKSL